MNTNREHSRSRYAGPRSLGWGATAILLFLLAGALGAQGQQTDLSVTLSDSVDPVVAGALLDYTISLTNSSATAASDVAVFMYAPTGTVQVFSSVLSGTGWSSGIIENSGVFGTQFSKTSVGAGETASFLIRVRVASTLLTGATVSGPVFVTTTTTDSNLTNNTDTESTSITQDADLAVSLVSGPDPVSAGANLTYMFSLSNFGPSGAQSVAVTLPVPPNTTFLSALVNTGSGWSITSPSVGGTGNVIFSKGTVTYQEAAVFKVLVSVQLGASGTITGTATATSPTPDSVSGNDSDGEPTTVSGTPLPVFKVPVFTLRKAGF